MKKALITGITGQDGSYLAELLLEKGYKVYGMVRHSANPNPWRLKSFIDKVTIVDGDLADQSSLTSALKKSDPDEVYNLAAQSYVGLSWDQPMFTADVTGIGVLRFLDAIKNYNKNIKFYQAGSSEQFGKVQAIPQNENTKFYPRSPYGVAKCFAHYITVNYRESYGMFCVPGILFNHESERRGIEFVTRKISNSVARIALGLDKKLKLGNLDSKRDWSHARDMVRGMWMMMQQDTPEGYVLSSGKTHTVREFCDRAFRIVGLNYIDYVEIDPAFIRPAEVDILVGDSTQAREKLGWVPEVGFDELVSCMVKSDLDYVDSLIKKGKL